jgi:hypothetical protein
MHDRLKLAVYGSLAVLAFDAIASAASRAVPFPYARASAGSYIIYAVLGFLAWRLGRFSFAAQLGAILGLVDASAGWAISTALHAVTPPMPAITPILWAVVAITVMITGVICSLIGAAVAKLTTRAQAPTS